MVSAIERQILQSKVIERIQQVQQQHPDLQQQYFEVHLGQERLRMTKKINESEEMYHIDFSEEEKKDQKERQKKHDTSEPGGDGEASSEKEQHGHIDIKV
jgi:ABC-type siderophore export system fused ATPase/permease subunit